MKRNRNELVTVVKQLKENDSYAFSRLYELTYQKLYFFCYSLLKNEHDAQDALQETYIKIYSNLHSLENDDSFVVWMNKISYNVCITMIKKRRSYWVKIFSAIFLPIAASTVLKKRRLSLWKINSWLFLLMNWILLYAPF